jgi:hypothetical protein
MLRKIFASGIALSSFYLASAQDVAVVKTQTASTSTSNTQTANAQASEILPAVAEEDPKPEEKKSNFTFSAWADVYYRYDFGKTAANNKTSFTNSHNSFELGMASVKLEHAIGKVSMVADLGFGKRAEEFSYAEEKTRFAIKQLYLSYQLGKVKLTAGSWATHVGYELVDAPLNRNYSMSYMFSYGPFLHTGVKAETSIGKNGFMLGIANPTDLKSTTMDSKYIIAQYSTASANDKIKFFLNFQSGKPGVDAKQTQFDAVLTGAVSDKFSVGLNGTVNTFKFREADGKFGSSDSWYGTAVYLNLDPKPWFGMTLRSEYFNDKKQLNVFSSAVEGGNVFANTLSFNFKVDNLIFIPEIRYESASQEIFTKADGGAAKTSANVLLAAVYKF